MKRKRVKFLVLAAFLLFGSSAFAEGIGTFTSIEGKVDVFKLGQGEAAPAAEGQAIAVGDVVRTKRASKAEITFADNTVIRLADETRVEIKEYQVDQKKKRINAVINVDRGKIRAIVSKANGKADFTINTPNASGNVKGTDVIVFYQKSSTGVVVVDGKFSTFNLSQPDKVVTVTGGNTSVIPPDEPPQEPRTSLAMEMERHEADTKVIAKRKETLKAEGYEEPGQMKATVVKVAGDVRIRSRGAISWHDAKVGEILSAGDEIETKEDGKIEIRLDNNNVINLKPHSQLILQKLTQDLQTGDYENLLESNIGKIRAKVEKIKGSSKFEIKTPTAVAAVKGTVLYLNILPNLTSAYFEGGNGTLNNIISGVTQVVGDGNSSSADDQGNTSEPSPPSDEQKSEWTEGWETEGGAEGYSPPGGEGEGETGGEEEGGGAPDTDAGGGDTSPFDEVPITETSLPPSGGEGGGTGSGEGGGETPRPTLSGDFVGNFGSYGSFNIDEDSSIDATLTSDITLFDASDFDASERDGETGTLLATLSGTYSNPNGHKLWWGDLSGDDVDGGAFEGWAGGSWYSWEGVVSTIYIDSDGNAGYFGNLFNPISGTNDEATGTFTGDGDLFVAPITENIGILPADLSDSLVPGSGSGNLYVSFLDGDGFLDVQFSREMMKIRGESWGIWREIYSGTYDREDGLTEWTGVAGGDYNEEGYFFSTIGGIDDLNGSLRMDILGTYLDYTKLGAYGGTILGTYTQGNSYDFEGIGLGAFVEGAEGEGGSLTSSGRLYNSIYYYGNGNGRFNGLIGVIDPLQVGSDSYVASIGYLENYSSDKPFIWFSRSDIRDTLYSYNPFSKPEPTYTTYDNWAFYGMTGGIGGDNELDGWVNALYIAPSDTEGIYNAGIITGNLNGVYSNYVGYLLSGTLTPNEPMALNIGLNPEDLYYSISRGGGRGTLAGSFVNSGGEITGWDNLLTMSIVNNETGIAQNWGIYGQIFNGEFYGRDSDTEWSAMMGGYDSFGAYYRWGENPGEGWFNNDSGYWVADITNGVWDDIAADLDGRFLTYTKMGTLDGEIHGIYDDSAGDWQAVGFGSWEGTPLAWSTDIDAAYHYYTYDDYGDGYGEEWIEYYDDHYGIIGATESPFPASPATEKTVGLTLMGETYPYGYITWGGYLSDSYADNSVIPDGFVAGRTNSLEGMLVALYIDGLGNAGTLKGNFTGDYFDGINMWQASGNMTAIQMATGYDPNSYNTHYYDIDGFFYGNFDGGGGIYANYGYSLYDMAWGYLYSYTSSLRNLLLDEDEHWGIYNIVLGGGYDSETDNWTLDLGGNSWRGLNTEYWLATITGTRWSNQRIAGNLSGQYITDIAIGTIEGDVLGSYDTDSDYTWEAIALGTFSEEPLTFSGYWGDDSLYNNYDNGNFKEAWVGEEYGLVGSTTPNWWNETTNGFEFLAMGEYYVDYSGIEPYIWNTQINSYNANESNSTTLDGGAFWGYTGGIWNNQIMDGAVAALYIDPNGNAGVLRGDVSGTYYPQLGSDSEFYDYGMWAAEGTLTPTQMVQGIGISPENLYNYVESDYIYNWGLYGDFGDDFSFGESYIYGWQYSGYSYSIGENDTWGIFDIKLGNENRYYNPDNLTTWSAVMGGSDEDEDGIAYWLANLEGTWANDEIRADVTGRILSDDSLGIIEGDFFGVNNGEEGTWIATVVGSWSETPLTFSGFWGDEWEDYLEEGFSLYRNDEGYLDEVGEDYGLIGSTTPEWWNQDSFPIIAMGGFSTSTDDEPLIWNTLIFSYNASEGNFTTQDGAAFWGYTGGLWRILNDVGMDGAVAALYIDPNGNAGYMRGEVLGDYYSGLGMWMVEGALSPFQLVQDIGITPEELIEYVDEGLLEAYVYGGFFGNSEDESYIDGEYSWGETNFINTYDGENTFPWGIYDLKLEGPESYSNPAGSTIWFAWIEGTGEFGEYDVDGEYDYDGEHYSGEWYPNGSWAGLMGGIWRNGEIQGALRALYVTEQYNAGLMQGDVFGLYDEIKEGYGTWIGESIGTFAMVDVTEVTRDSFDAFYGIDEGEFFGTGLGSFAGGGALEATSVEGIAFNIADQDWGIWAAIAEGSYEGPTSPFKLAFGGSDPESETYLLGTINGDFDSGILEGYFRGVWLGVADIDGETGEVLSFDAGSMTGEVIGTHDELDTTWQAASVGEWIELAELDTDVLGFNNEALAAMVEVPITETYASLLQGTGGFGPAGNIGNITGAMDISFYAAAAQDLSGIWAALISGSYTGPTSDNWILTLSDRAGIDATLTGTQWSPDGQWLANVSGTAPNDVCFNGQAGGTYTGTDSGTFTGVGAGTWEHCE